MRSNELGNVIRGNRVWRNADDGIDMWNGAPALVEGNWAWENGYDDNLKPLGNGNGFKLGGQNAGVVNSGGHTVRNNVAWKNLQNGFVENSATRALTLYNNTAWNNKSYQFRFDKTDLKNILRNNLSFGGSNFLKAPGDSANDSWSLPVTVNETDFESLDDTIARGSRVSGICGSTMPSSGFLKLKSGSDLINKGVDVGIVYLGSKPDLGAFEKE
jgi:hypothetical protein